MDNPTKRSLRLKRLMIISNRIQMILSFSDPSHFKKTLDIHVPHDIGYRIFIGLVGTKSNYEITLYFKTLTTNVILKGLKKLIRYFLQDFFIHFFEKNSLKTKNIMDPTDTIIMTSNIEHFFYSIGNIKINLPINVKGMILSKIIPFT